MDKANVFDPQTREFYSANAALLADQYRSAAGGVETWFSVAFPEGCRVLDIGCSAGRDVSILLQGGWNAFGVDPCPEFIDEGLRFDPSLDGRLFTDALPALSTIPDNAFDGVLCSAVLMHLPEEILFDAAFGLRRVLKPGGRLLVSLPLDKKGEPFTGRDERGRFHNGLSPERLELLLSRLGFTCIGRGENSDSLGRVEKKWVVMLFALGTDGEERSIDKIESFLNRDRKVATYKLALFRALAEIGMTQYNRARWIHGGMVALPIRAVAEKWLEYYWPIVASQTFIPQIQGESPTSGKPIAFRSLMEELASRYRLRGGLSGFLIDVRSGNLRGYRKVETSGKRNSRESQDQGDGKQSGKAALDFAFDPGSWYCQCPVPSSFFQDLFRCQQKTDNSSCGTGHRIMRIGHIRPREVALQQAGKLKAEEDPFSGDAFGGQIQPRALADVKKAQGSGKS